MSGSTDSMVSRTRWRWIGEKWTLGV